MTAATLPSKKNERTLAEAQEDANDGAVFLTGEYGLSHVLMTIADYERLIRGKLNIVEMLWMPGMADIDFDPSVDPA